MNSGLTAELPDPPPPRDLSSPRACWSASAGPTARCCVATGSRRTADQRLVLGHESLGRVVAAPPDAPVQPGDLVVGVVRRPDPLPCPACAAGRWDFCANGQYTERGHQGPARLWGHPLAGRPGGSPSRSRTSSVTSAYSPSRAASWRRPGSRSRPSRPAGPGRARSRWWSGRGRSACWRHCSASSAATRCTCSTRSRTGRSRVWWRRSVRPTITARSATSVCGRTSSSSAPAPANSSWNWPAG